MLITWKGFGEKIKQGRGIWIVVDGELFWNVRWMVKGRLTEQVTWVERSEGSSEEHHR